MAPLSASCPRDVHHAPQPSVSHVPKLTTFSYSANQNSENRCQTSTATHSITIGRHYTVLIRRQGFVAHRNKENFAFRGEYPPGTATQAWCNFCVCGVGYTHFSQGIRCSGVWTCSPFEPKKHVCKKRADTPDAILVCHPNVELCCAQRKT